VTADSTMFQQPSFLPMTTSEMDRLGWKELDILLVTGDTYVDHPAFGSALLGRYLVAHGYRVGIIAQPRWTDTGDIMRLGRPRLFAGVTSGALDSMLAHYTAFRKKRSDDAYTPGGKAGLRPNRAVIVYSNLVKQAFPGLPLVIGGIEASMRRISHYDFWTDSVRRSVLLDSKADALIYGMAETALLEVAKRLTPQDVPAPPQRSLGGIRGTVSVAGAGHPATPPDVTVDALPSHEDVVSNPQALMQATLQVEAQVHEGDTWLTQKNGDRTIVVAPPAIPLAGKELDALFDLPFARSAHPSYRDPIPALKTIQFTVTTHRGCAGGCTFCSLALHQGRRIQSRSPGSISRETAAMVKHRDWHGTIENVGGPTANMWNAICKGPSPCKRRSCLWPGICRHFHPAQKELAELLRGIAQVRGVENVRSASGIRHDLAVLEPAYVDAIVSRFTGGHLTVAPEHSEAHVLDLMRKPSFTQFEQFHDSFMSLSASRGKKQYLVPYLLTAFPGCTDTDMRKLAGWFRERHWKPRQVQCFIPTPGTVATAMFWSGKDESGRKIHVARTDAERMRQHYILVPTDSNAGSRSQPD